MGSLPIRPASGGSRRRVGHRRVSLIPPHRRRRRGCAVAPVGTGVQAIRPSPWRAGLAGPPLQRLPVRPASTAGDGPLWLSPPGKPLTPRCLLRTSPFCEGDRMRAYAAQQPAAPLVDRLHRPLPRRRDGRAGCPPPADSGLRAALSGRDTRWCLRTPGSNCRAGSRHRTHPTSRLAPSTRSLPLQRPTFHPRWCPEGAWPTVAEPRFWWGW